MFPQVQLSRELLNMVERTSKVILERHGVPYRGGCIQKLYRAGKACV
jgi:hypothetical protein